MPLGLKHIDKLALLPSMLHGVMQLSPRKGVEASLFGTLMGRLDKALGNGQQEIDPAVATQSGIAYTAIEQGLLHCYHLEVDMQRLSIICQACVIRQC